MLTSGSRERRREECWDGSREPHPEIPFSLAKQVAALYFSRAVQHRLFKLAPGIICVSGVVHAM